MLFDKDGTLCLSGSYLTALAIARADFCGSLSGINNLQAPLLAAYGISEKGIDPAGATAVASRQNNLISTATVLAIHGVDWCQAQQWAETALAQADVALADRKAKLTPPTPGLVAMLQRLQERGITMAILSSDIGSSLEDFLLEHQLMHFFKAIYGADRNPAKPDPAAAISVCEILAVNPGACGMVGDAEADLSMAAAAGLGWSLAYQGGWDLPLQLSGSHGHLQHWDQFAPL